MVNNVLHRGVLSTYGVISHVELRKDRGFDNRPLYHLYDVYKVNGEKVSMVRGFGGYDNLDEAISAYGRVLGIEISDDLREYIKEKDTKITLIAMEKLYDYSRYYNGARMAILSFWDMFKPCIKGEERIYLQAVITLITSDIRNTEKFMSGAEIRYVNHQRKGKKLISVEAEFIN